MKLGRFSRAKLLAALVTVSTVAFLTGCDALGGPQNTFAPKGEVASKQKDLFLLVMWPALVIGIFVGIALIYALVRYRYKPGDPEPKQIHGNNRLELTWTILPAVLCVGIAVLTLNGIIDLGRSPRADDLHVNVTGVQWSWRFEYTDPQFAKPDGKPLAISTELHVPVGKEVAISLDAKDVIHSFWVPKLAGKTDAIPGRANRMWFKADEPGTYSGQCAEFCGIGHPDMTFKVIAVSQDEFDAWVQDQLAGNPQPTPEATPQ
jgi:cytochrome c oxidase subunit 2